MPNSEVYFQSEMKNLYPNSSITVTSDYRFNILAYAAQAEDPVLLREMDMEGLKKVVFIPPASRRYGKGVVAESVSVAGWNVGWRDSEFKVIVTSVSNRRQGGSS
jgi:hypothetical protein